MVTFTPHAYAELIRRVNAFDQPDAIVGVYWLTAEDDLVRSPDGRAVWKQTPARWAVCVTPLPTEEFETDGDQATWKRYVREVHESLIRIGDLRVHFSPEGSGATGVTVAYTGSEFHVQQSDA